jgi:hypothetical protein
MPQTIPNTKPTTSTSPDRKEPPRFFQARGGMMAGKRKPKKAQAIRSKSPPNLPKKFGTSAPIPIAIGREAWNKEGVIYFYLRMLMFPQNRVM